MERELTSFLPMEGALALRTLLRDRRALSLLTLLAVSASVALASGLELGARAVKQQIERTESELVGAAQLEITNGDLGVPEEILAKVAAVPGVELAAPIVQETVFLRGERPPEALRILGVDLLQDRKVRSYSQLEGDLRASDPLQLVGDPDAIIISQALARRRGLAQGALLRVHKVELTHDLVVRGIFVPGGVADAFDGQLAVMDVYALQALVGRHGALDRIDLVLGQDTSPSKLQTTLEKIVAGRASVRVPAARNDSVDRAMGTVFVAVGVLSLMGVVAAAIISFSTMTLSVERRLPELALLRIVGADRSHCRRLVWSEALVLASLGTVLGLVAAIHLSGPFRAAFSSVLHELQNSDVREVQANQSTYLVGATVGALVALLGGVLPVRRAVASAPLEALRAARGVAQGPWPHRGRWIVDASLVLLCMAGFAGLPSGSARVRLALVLLSALALLALNADRVLVAAISALGWIFQSIDPGLGRLAGSGLVARARDVRGTLVAVAGIVAALTAMLVVVETMITNLDEWQSAGLDKAIVVGRPSGGSLVSDDLPRATIARIRATPGVVGVCENILKETIFRDQTLQIFAYERKVFATYGEDHDSIGADPNEVTQALLRGEVAVDDQVARRFSLHPGDRIALSTPSGGHEFRIASLMRPSPDGVGAVTMDLATFDRFWPRDEAKMLLLWVDGPVDDVLDRIRASIDPSDPLFFVHGDALAHSMRRVFARFDWIFYSLFGLTGALGGSAIAGLLLASMLERRRELLLLRAAGASRAHLRRIIFYDAAALGLIGALLGVSIGLLVARPFADVIAEAFGWTLAIAVPKARIGELAVAVIATALVVAIYPAFESARATGRPSLAEE